MQQPKKLNIKVQKTIDAKWLEAHYPECNFDLYQHFDWDAGFDVKACIKSPTQIVPGERCIIPTGLLIEISEPNWEIQVRPRSGLAAKHGLMVVNSPGTIDYGYRDEIKVILLNAGKELIEIQTGSRIAQLCFREIPKIEMEYVDFISKDIDRGGGFGSSDNN